MLLKYFYDSALAHASYLVGCQRTNEALIVDPGRDVAEYLHAAKEAGMRIVGVAETHIHADYLSGARELAEVGAKLYLSAEGGPDWQYHYLTPYPHQRLDDGDSFMVGNVQLTALHTPGHTPESLSFLLTDLGGGANKPMGLFTGDFLFVGSIGRPDLLEKAVGVEGSAQKGARELFASLQKLADLPDYLQIWPAHGAGSACGKGLGAIPSSTLGYERLFNPAFAYDDEASFVQYLLADQPEPPLYFATMKRINKAGPVLLRELPDVVKPSAENLPQLVQEGLRVIDTRSQIDFATAHLPGSWNIPTTMLAEWGGWLLHEKTPYLLIVTPEKQAESLRILRKIGLDEVRGTISPAEVAEAGLFTQAYQQERPAELSGLIFEEKVTLIDVRAQTEWNGGHLPFAHHIMLGYLPQRLAQLPQDRPIVLHCLGGARSAIGVSILQAAGFNNVINLEGGYRAWVQANLPIEK